MKMSSDKNPFLDELDHWLLVTDKLMTQSGLSPNLEGSSNGQHLLQDSFEHNANATPQVTSGGFVDLSWSFPPPIRGDSRMVQDSLGGQPSFLDPLKTFELTSSTDIFPSFRKSFEESWSADISSIPLFNSPNLEGSSNGQHLSPISADSRMVQDSSDGQLLFPDALKPVMQIAYAGAQVTSIPPVLFAQNAPKTPVMHRGKKRQDTADNFEVGCNMLPQKFRSLPHHRRNSPPISSLSNHTGSVQGLGNYPTPAEISMPRGRAFNSFKLKATYGMLSGETLTPDALANTSQPLQVGMPSEDRCETSTIEGNNIRNAITDHDVMGYPTHMEAQPSLRSVSTQPSSSFSSIESIHLLFHNLIALPLPDLSDPDKETSMKNVLAILADNLSSFSGKQGDQILGLLLEFPALARNWREWYSQFQMYSQQSSAETEKSRDLMENSGKDEESLKVRYDKLKNNEKELMTQLDEVQKQKAEIAEQRTEKSKLTKDLKEKEAHQNKEERLMRIAATKLGNLSDKWAKLQAFFI